MTFTSLEQRMAKNYIDMFPPFVPDENAPVSVLEQELFYSLMKSFYQLAFDEPLLFVASLHEDDVFPNRFNKSAYGKPKLLRDMKKFTKTIDDLLQNMFLLGQSNNVKLNKRQQVILSRIGIKDFANLPTAWTFMATRKGADLSAFSHCLFNEDYPYTSDIYARLFGEFAYKKLEDWMLEKGYKRFNIYLSMAIDCKLSLCIVNPKWSKDTPSGGFEYKIKHTGIAALLEPCVVNPQIFGVCIPNDMIKTYIENFNSMSEKLQDFVIKRHTKCWGCNFCIQTDKTGKRPNAYIPTIYKQQTYNLCLRFPGYAYAFNHIDDELAEQLIEMLTFMDNFAPKNKLANHAQ